jgi:hypothetical protein
MCISFHLETNLFMVQYIIETLLVQALWYLNEVLNRTASVSWNRKRVEWRKNVLFSSELSWSLYSRKIVLYGLEYSILNNWTLWCIIYSYCYNDFHNLIFYRFVSSFILQGKDPMKECENEKGTVTLWGVEKLQAYFSTVKTLNPVFTEEATLVLRRYYQVQRQTDCRNAARTTVRLLESLVRYV